MAGATGEESPGRGPATPQQSPSVEQNPAVDLPVPKRRPRSALKQAAAGSAKALDTGGPAHTDAPGTSKVGTSFHGTSNEATTPMRPLPKPRPLPLGQHRAKPKSPAGPPPTLQSSAPSEINRQASVAASPKPPSSPPPPMASSADVEGWNPGRPRLTPTGAVQQAAVAGAAATGSSKLAVAAAADGQQPQWQWPQQQPEQWQNRLQQAGQEPQQQQQQQKQKQQQPLPLPRQRGQQELQEPEEQANTPEQHKQQEQERKQENGEHWDEHQVHEWREQHDRWHWHHTPRGKAGQRFGKSNHGNFAGIGKGQMAGGSSGSTHWPRNHGQTMTTKSVAEESIMRWLSWFLRCGHLRHGIPRNSEGSFDLQQVAHSLSRDQNLLGKQHVMDHLKTWKTWDGAMLSSIIQEADLEGRFVVVEGRLRKIPREDRKPCLQTQRHPSSWPGNGAASAASAPSATVAAGRSTTSFVGTSGSSTGISPAAAAAVRPNSGASSSLDSTIARRCSGKTLSERALALKRLIEETPLLDKLPRPALGEDAKDETAQISDALDADMQRDVQPSSAEDVRDAQEEAWPAGARMQESQKEAWPEDAETQEVQQEAWPGAAEVLQPQKEPWPEDASDHTLAQTADTQGSHCDMGTWDTWEEPVSEDVQPRQVVLQSEEASEKGGRDEQGALEDEETSWHDRQAGHPDLHGALESEVQDAAPWQHAASDPYLNDYHEVAESSATEIWVPSPEIQPADAPPVSQQTDLASLQTQGPREQAAFATSAGVKDDATNLPGMGAVAIAAHSHPLAEATLRDSVDNNNNPVAELASLCAAAWQLSERGVHLSNSRSEQSGSFGDSGPIGAKMPGGSRSRSRSRSTGKPNCASAAKSRAEYESSSSGSIGSSSRRETKKQIRVQDARVKSKGSRGALGPRTCSSSQRRSRSSSNDRRLRREERRRQVWLQPAIRSGRRREKKTRSRSDVKRRRKESRSSSRERRRTVQKRSKSKRDGGRGKKNEKARKHKRGLRGSMASDRSKSKASDNCRSGCSCTSTTSSSGSCSVRHRSASSVRDRKRKAGSSPSVPERDGRSKHSERGQHDAAHAAQEKPTVDQVTSLAVPGTATAALKSPSAGTGVSSVQARAVYSSAFVPASRSSPSKALDAFLKRPVELGPVVVAGSAIKQRPSAQSKTAATTVETSTHYLVQSDDKTGHHQNRWPLILGKTYKIGRADGGGMIDIGVKHGLMSREHCTLKLEGQVNSPKLVITDLDSTHGTIVNNNKMTKGCSMTMPNALQHKLRFFELSSVFKVHSACKSGPYGTPVGR